MKGYESYKVGVLPWAEAIPSHWSIQRAKTMYRKEARSIQENDEVVTCFRDGQVTLRKNRRTTGFTESIKEVGYQGIKKGDLVIHVMDAFAGAIGVSDSDGKGTPVYSVCTPKGEFNNYYYAYVIREMAKTGFIQSLYRGIRERSSDFRFEVFANQLMPVPSIAEQNQIVRYLDWQVSKINKWIRSKKEELTLLQEQKQAIINTVLTKGLSADIAMKDSDIEGVETIPSDWIVAPLKKFVKSNIESLTNNEDGDLEIKYLDISSVGFGLLRAQPVTYKFKDAPSRARRKVHSKDTIISTVRTYLKSMCYIDESISDCIVSTGFAVLSPKGNINPKLLFYMLSSSYFIDQVQRSSVGISYPAISEMKLLSLKIIVPNTYEEQEQIYEFLNREHSIVEQAEKAIKREIKKITEYREALVSTIVTGKIDVRDILVPEYEPLQAEEIAGMDEEYNIIELNYGEEE